MRHMADIDAIYTYEGTEHIQSLIVSPGRSSRTSSPQPTRTPPSDPGSADTRTSRPVTSTVNGCPRYCTASESRPNRRDKRPRSVTRRP